MTFLECIKYINDLDIEIKMLEEAKRDCHDERDWQNLTRIIEYKKSKMQLYKDNLSKLSNCQIEYRIYLKMLNGLSPTRAVEEVAGENYISGKGITSLSQIWNKNYKKLKKIIKS